MRKWLNWRLLVTGGVAVVSAAVMAAAPASAAPGNSSDPVSGAAFTTTNPAEDNGATGTPTLCLNGNPGTSGPNYVPAINCNIYTSKSYVWLSGGPGSSHLSDGTYFFTVLVPGGQPDPNDGGLKNLSDATCAPYTCPATNGDSSTIPSGDLYGNRTFTITGGTISYGGSHTFSDHLIRLFPYDDTTNAGGVYIMAICSLGANGTTYPVAPSNCKYDAFKVQETNVPVPPAADLFVTKDAAGTDVNTFKWGIKKGVDQTTINSSSGSATFNYTVTVTHDTGTVSDVEVTGTIQVFNPNTNGTGGTLAVSISGVTDQLSDGTSCSVSGVPESLTAFETDLAYTCDLSGLPQALNNTATVSWSDQALSDGATLTGGSADFTFSNISFTESAIDDCVTVSDTFGGSLGTICSKASSPQDLTYSHEFTGNTAGTCTSHTNTATFTTNTTSTTGSDSKIVNVCVGADLTVAKTATPSFTRTYGWSILKGVDPARQNIASGGSATFNYTVNAGETGFTDSGWQVKGTITVTNLNDWEAITANVTDAIDNGGICTVTGGTSVVVPKSDHVTLNYTCTYSSAPSAASGTNTATATWDSGAASTPSGSDDGTKIFAFNDGSAGNPTRVHQTVTITDAFNGGAPSTLGTLTATDAAPFASSTYNESRNLSGAPGTCTDYPNVATIVETNQNSNATVKVCVGVDLTVSKTATPSFTRTYNWTISKNVDKTLLDAGGTATYTVTATQTGFTDSAWKVSGTITVANPNDWEAITINVTDTIDHSGTCVVTGGVGVTVPKSGSVALAYICSFSANPLSGTNTGTASWDSGTFFTPHGSASGGASYLFGDPTNRVNQTITIADTILGVTTTLGTLTATDAPTFTTHAYVYTRHFNPPSSGCVTITNTAKIVETNATATATVRVCNTGALTIGFWQNKNGQAIIRVGGSTAGVCNSGTWLRQFAPFQDLSATATCAQVASYFTAVFNIANAGGTTMNPMLKAQMLATALNVYFSNPALGGNQIGATAPIGGLVIDLSKIYGGEDVSAAFGGSTSLTVTQMLSYAASQSNAGGSSWYGNVKATQGLAKDAFDSINNQTAVSP